MKLWRTAFLLRKWKFFVRGIAAGKYNGMIWPSSPPGSASHSTNWLVITLSATHHHHHHDHHLHHHRFHHHTKFLLIDAEDDCNKECYHNCYSGSKNRHLTNWGETMREARAVLLRLQFKNIVHNTWRGHR